MSFSVDWAQSSLDSLAALWIRADSAMRRAIREAVNEVDHRLRGDPLAQGESRGGNDRVLFVFPLGVRYEVQQAHRMVRVLAVWEWKRQ